MIVTAGPGLATTPPEQLQLKEEGKMQNEEAESQNQQEQEKSQ